MSREIKFRIYNDEDDRMEDVTEITMFCDDGCLVSTSFEGGDESEWCVPMQLIQYTGLKDVNGVEIFEGDILKDDQNCCLWVVEFGERGGFVASEPNARIPDHVLLDDYDFEVIGNIHQNPELLEE